MSCSAGGCLGDHTREKEERFRPPCIQYVCLFGVIRHQEEVGLTKFAYVLFFVQHMMYTNIGRLTLTATLYLPTHVTVTVLSKVPTNDNDLPDTPIMMNEITVSGLD